MKVGDLVRSKRTRDNPRKAGLLVDIVEKKCWRTHELGRKVDWGKIEPEPHAVILVGEARLSFPLVDLEVVNERG